MEFDVREKVRLAREQAALATTNLRDSVANKVDDARELYASGLADFREAGTARIREALEDFNAALPALREAGYTLTEVSVSMGIPPTVTAAFHASDSVTEESAAHVIEKNKDRKLTVFLVRTLLQAWKLQTSINIAGMKPRGISVEIGLSPGVVVKFA